MVIGDPQQIEPVFTLPSALITATSALSPHTAAGQYSPNRASVQMQADAANRYGTTVSGEEADGLWIGGPLRVHRRCIDPMFGLANQIACQNKMVFGLEERRPAGDAPPSHRRSPHRHLSPGRRIAGPLYHFAVQGDQEQSEAGSGPCNMG
jgi:hypothetical protein